jgi:pectate lyase
VSFPAFDGEHRQIPNQKTQEEDMKNASWTRRHLLAALILTALVACGGGGDGTPAASSSVSSSAGSSLSSSSDSSGSSASSSSDSSSSSSYFSSSSSSSSAPAVAGCAGTEWFCDDFQAGNADKWDLLPASAVTSIGTANGSVSFDNEAGNGFLRYTAGTSKGVVAAVKDSAFTGVSARATADYYVEARIRPINNSTSNKYICLLGRYVDPGNWNGACLNVQNSASSRVEFHKATTAGGWNRTKQFSNRSILNDNWYKLRLEMVGSSMTLYINDELVGTQVDANNTAAGRIGLWLDNRSFDVDDIVVGDAAIKPVLLSMSPTADWVAEVGDADRTVTVTATKGDGTVDAYTAVSSKPEVVSVSSVATATGGVTTLKAVGAGTATITFTSGSKSTLSKTITATISPQFVMPTATYGSISSKTTPAAGSSAAYADDVLALSFDSAPAIGTAGSIRIFKSSDDSLVDVIKLVNETNTLGPVAVSGTNYYRGVAMPLVKVSGNSLLIRPHGGKLQYDTQYYVAISDDVVTNAARLNGSTFTGIGKAGGWSFTTRSAPAAGLASVTVDDDGSSAHFRSIQAALNYASANAATTVINLQDGRYDELLYLRGRANLTIRGQSRNGTIIAAENYDGLNTGSGSGSTSAAAASGGGRALFLAEDTDLLTLENLTMENTHVKKVGVAGQAEVIYFKASAAQRLVAKNMDFISRQDTIQTNGYAWFYNTLIAGDVDFIWGSAKAALFESSEIRTRVDSTDASKGGYIIQARVGSATDKGYVFLNSSLTREAGVPDGATVLGRSAGNNSYDNVTYINCKMDDHIAAAGWHLSPLPTPGTPTASAGWKEYGSMKLDGSVLSLSGRVSAARMLSAGEAAAFSTREQVFSAISWVPAP